jgi:hypothetical protein
MSGINEEGRKRFRQKYDAISGASYQFNVAYDPKIFESSIPKTVKRRDWKMGR